MVLDFDQRDAVLQKIDAGATASVVAAAHPAPDFTVPRHIQLSSRRPDQTTKLFFTMIRMSWSKLVHQQILVPCENLRIPNIDIRTFVDRVFDHVCIILQHTDEEFYIRICDAFSF